MTQCAKIIVGFMANVGNVFFIRQTFFLIFISTFITSMIQTVEGGAESRPVVWL